MAFWKEFSRGSRGLATALAAGASIIAPAIRAISVILKDCNARATVQPHGKIPLTNRFVFGAA
jgi:hypothetical protein